MTIVAAKVEGKANRIIVGYTNIIGYGFVSMNKGYLNFVFLIYLQNEGDSEREDSSSA